ncbi:MAG: hypothetical protein WBA23_21160, partial [Tunicatimonas sp.]|uniref:hypothetical protein n=1 Tax=Tunicatimonas sp. TaxID=1940096 RepID=UPI003C78E9F3
MKKAVTIFNAVVMVVLTAVGCEDEVENLATDSSAVDRVQVGDLTFTLQILNMQDEPQAVFEKGENFQFQFVIENRGDSTYQLPVYWIFPSQNPEFFTLYKKTQESGGKARLGRSFDMGSNFYDLSPEVVPAKGKTIYTMPWLTDRDSVYLMPVYEQKGKLLEQTALA